MNGTINDKFIGFMKSDLAEVQISSNRASTKCFCIVDLIDVNIQDDTLSVNFEKSNTSIVSFVSKEILDLALF